MNPLDNLNDITEPAGVAIWPLAWGWWLLVAVGLICIILLVMAIYRYLKAYAPRKMTLRMLNAQLADGSLTLSSANTLLKRVCMTYSGRQNIAALHGKDWVNTLKNAMKSPNKRVQLSERLAIFEQSQYQAEIHSSQQEIFNITRDWLRAIDIRQLQRLSNNEANHV